MTEDQGLLFGELSPDHRSGYVALMGKPNVGKSTLLNAWMGYKIAAVSPKPQTTRTRMLGILTEPKAQIIFVDTPGIHVPRTKLGDYMVATARRAVPDADVVLFIVDMAEPPTRADEELAELVKRVKYPVILVLNKVDLVPIERAETLYDAYTALGEFDETVQISALTGFGVDELLDMVRSKLPYGPRYYPADQVTDQQERFVAAELIREQFLRLLAQEVPHALAVVVDEFKERSNGSLYISANVFTEKESQKGIVIGRGGSMLKKVGREARQALEEFFEKPVYVDLWVKVRKNWRRSASDLSELGYSISD
jgi:GTP-binding protein Era